MSEKTRHLVAGCTIPSEEQLQEFWVEAKQHLASDTHLEDYQVRWIGGDADSTAGILQHIRTGNKTGTVSVPWVVENSGQPETRVGDAIILIEYDGTPAVLLRITDIETVAYGDITEAHTALDGPRVRAIDVWKPLHVRYFDMLLQPYGLKVDDNTPIAFEKFELLYAR